MAFIEARLGVLTDLKAKVDLFNADVPSDETNQYKTQFDSLMKHAEGEAGRGDQVSQGLICWSCSI